MPALSGGIWTQITLPKIILATKSRCLIWLNTATDYSINHAAPWADRGKRIIMRLFDDEVLKIVANIGFPILSFINICLIFHHWKTTDWGCRTFRILMICLPIAFFYKAISKSTGDDAIYAITFGFVPVTMLFAYLVLTEKI